MDASKLEQEWAERGFSFGTGTIRAGDGVKEAVHKDQDELVLMETGKFEFILDHESFIQEGNSEVLIPAGAIHTINNIGSNDAKIYFGYRSINT